MPAFADTLTRIGDLSAPTVPVSLSVLRDAELLIAQRQIGEVQRRVNALAASVAGEIAHRSRRELGASGLAATQGLRSAEDLIAKVTGGSTRDARTLVKAAELLPTAHRSTDAVPVPEWQRIIGAAVADASISVEAAGVIRTRLGAAADRAPEAAVADAARTLIAAAPGMKLEDLAARASVLRDQVDLAGIPAREDELRAKRFLRFTKQLDGMTRVTGLLDQESAAIATPILDAATSPRRGGPRFVDPAAVERAEDVMRDERTTDQLTLDVFVQLVRNGSRVDDGTLLGDRKPVVRVLVTKNDLERPRDENGTRIGAAFFEGQTDAVSVATAERFICSGGAVPIDHWDEHHGSTDIDDGVLVCRFCHLNLHNQRWRIRRDRAEYFLERPDHDGVLRRIPLPTRSPALDRLRATA